MNEDKVKVVLTRPAVDRLIGGDSEVEIQLRHATAQEIIKKHIVPLLHKDYIKEIVHSAKELLNSEVENILGGRTIVEKQDNWRSWKEIRYNFNDNIRKSIVDYAKSKEFLTEILEDEFSDETLDVIIKDIIKSKARSLLYDYIDRNLQLYIDKKVKERLEEIKKSI